MPTPLVTGEHVYYRDSATGSRKVVAHDAANTYPTILGCKGVWHPVRASWAFKTYSDPADTIIVTDPTVALVVTPPTTTELPAGFIASPGEIAGTVEDPTGETFTFLSYPIIGTDGANVITAPTVVVEPDGTSSFPIRNDSTVSVTLTGMYFQGASASSCYFLNPISDYIGLVLAPGQGIYVGVGFVFQDSTTLSVDLVVDFVPVP